MDRRHFLKGAAAAAAGAAVGSPFDALAKRFARGRGLPRRPRRQPDYGPLAPAIDRSTGLPLLALPQGFSYPS